MKCRRDLANLEMPVGLHGKLKLSLVPPAEIIRAMHSPATAGTLSSHEGSVIALKAPELKGAGQHGLQMIVQSGDFLD